MNNRLLISLVGAVAVLAAVFFMFRPAGEVRNYPPHAGPVVAFGDSLVAGTGATAGHDFVSVVSEKLGVPIENLGVPGDTTASALKRVDGVTAKKPSVVLVLLGGNDFLRRVPHSETFANLRTIIGKFQAGGAVVVLLGVRDGLLFSGSAEFEAVAKETQSAYVPDVLAGLFGDPKYMSDEVHPNDAGHMIIAGKVYPVLKRVLK